MTSPSRRTVLRATGALAVAGTALRGIPASAASRIPSFAGASQKAFAMMLESSRFHAKPTAVRWYMDAKTFPNTAGYASSKWPDITAKFNGSPAHALVSIRPDVDMLNAGMFDAGLYRFMTTAPKGPASLLTMWHECASYTHTIAAYPKVPKTFREGLSRLFFHYAWSWLQRFGPGGHSSGLLGFWADTGGEGSLWPPANTPRGSLDAMIAELNRENAASAP